MRGNPAGRRLSRLKRQGAEGRRQIHVPSRAARECILGCAKGKYSGCREIMSKARLDGTVPETDTGRKDE